MIHSERYRCQITRDDDGRIVAIELEAQDLDAHDRRVRIEGSRAAQAAGPLNEVLRAGNGGGRRWTGPAPLELDPVLGAQVELMLRALKPLRRVDRIVAVAEGVAGMSPEESSYWHAQTTRRHGLRALRTLLDGASRQ